MKKRNATQAKPKLTCEDIIKLQQNVPNCTMMLEGYNRAPKTFYYCSCDPDCQDPLCITCLNICHQSHWQGKPFEDLSNEYRVDICHCGLKNHTLLQNESEKDYLYKDECLFMEWSITSNTFVYYESQQNKATYLCMFCYNFCFKKSKEFIQNKSSDQLMLNIKCNCKHEDYNRAFEAIAQLVRKLVFVFESFSIRQFTQMVLLSKESFKNAFYKLNDILVKIGLEVHNSIFDFEPFSNSTHFMKGLDKILTMILNCHDIYYFNNDLSDSFDNIIPVIVKKFNYKTSYNIWLLKRNMFSLYHKVTFRSDFEELPCLTNNDVMNLNPFQRIMYCDYINAFSKKKHYLDFDEQSVEKKNYVDSLLHVIDKYKNIKAKNELSYEILKKVYSQLKKIIRFNMITKEQSAKFFRLNDEIIYNSINNRDIDYKSEAQQVGMLNQMVECVLYLAYYYNDQIIKEYVINNSMPLAKTAFFHRDNEFAQMMYKNTTHIVLYCRTIQSESEISQKQSSTSAKPLSLIKYNVVLKKLSQYCFQILFTASKITSLTLNFPDGYIKGLTGLLSKSCDSYIEVIKNELNEKNTEIIRKMQEENERLNSLYRKYFRFECSKETLQKQVIDVIQEIFGVLDKSDYSAPSYIKKVKDFTNNPIKKLKFRTMKGALILHKGKTEEEMMFLHNINLSKVLLNKTPIIFTLIKSIKIVLWNQASKEEATQNQFLVISYIENLFKILSFYIADSPDNCSILLTEKNLEAFILLPHNQMDRLINFLNLAIKTIKKGNICIIEVHKILKIIQVICDNVSGRHDTVNTLVNLLRLIKIIIRSEYLTKEKVITKLQKLMKHVFQANPILISFRDIIIPNKKDNNDFKTLNKMINENVVIEDYPILPLCHLFKNFLKIINYIFSDNSTLNESEFLTQILSKHQIPKIISDLTLYLSLRLEILKFYRIAYLDVMINTSKLPNYINTIISDRENNMDDNTSIFLFYQQLIEIKEKHLAMKIDSCILTFELKNFGKIVEKICSKKKLYEYFEEGIILPLHVFLNKYMSIIYNLNGNQYIKLYEIVLYFLELKLYLYVEGKKHKKHRGSSQFELQSLILNLLQSDKNKFSLIFEGMDDETLQLLENDIAELKNDSFEILNYKKVYSYFEKHVNGFVKLPKSDFLKELFSKKTVLHTPDKLKELEKEFRKDGLIKSIYEQRCFDLIHKYENDKLDFTETSLYHNLGEKNILYNATYRSILLRPMFYVINYTKLYLKSRRQNLWHIFRLLQYDTGGTQEDILSLYHSYNSKSIEKPIVNLNLLSNLFVKNFLSVIFSSCNPNATSTNEDYAIAYMIIKIFKYMCEDHNTRFQSIFFQEIQIEYENKEGKTHYLNMFELMMATLNKVILLAKWNQVPFIQDEDSISYFYEIFFVMIEFAIEMIQGTTKANLEKIISIKGKENELSFFYKFLYRTKPILTNNNNDSEIVYNVRLDIINFIVAFFEERKTPEKLINLIANLFCPFTIFNSIVNTLKKLYLKSTGKGDDVSKYETVEFDSRKCKYFISKYFENSEFSQSKEFELANRMYNYVKLLTNYNNKDAKYLIDSINMYKEDDLAKLFVQQSLSNDDEKVVINHDVFEDYYAVKFFESITRTVWIQGEDSKPQMVLFTRDPTVIFLSENTKNNFYRTVPRDNRSSKLFSLMEYCNYFFMEINHNKKRIEGECFLKILNKLNYHRLEDLLFLITVVINIIIFLKVENNEAPNDYKSTFKIVRPIGIVAMILNLTFLIFWIISKFSLYYVIEKEKYYLRKRKDKTEPLSFIESFRICLINTMLSKKEIISFLWNIIFSTIGVASSKNLFLFSLQLLIMVNLSPTLQNIVKAITMKYQQLLTTLLFLLISLYIFACLGFYFLSKDFVHTLQGNQENACGSLIYCFLTHMNFGLRTDGGIGEFIAKTSFIDSPAYFMGMFFFQLIFFILIIIIILAVIGGSIIDTFAELRAKTLNEFNDMNNICFICNGDRNAIEKQGENYDEHITKVHNIWTYVDYIIGLKFVDPQETNAINSFVIEKLEEKKISWFPSFTKNDEQSDDEEDN